MKKIKSILKRLCYQQRSTIQWYKVIGKSLVTMEINEDKIVCSQWFTNSEGTLLKWASDELKIVSIESFNQLIELEVKTCRGLQGIFEAPETHLDSLFPIPSLTSSLEDKLN